MKRTEAYFHRLWNLPKTIYFNVKVFGLREGMKLPVYITGNMRIACVYKGSIVIDAPKRRFMIELGEGGSEGLPNGKGSIYIAKGGKLIFTGNACFAQGCAIRIDKGTVIIGTNFNANKNCTVWSSNGIEIGSDVLFGYNIYLRDDDGHEIVTQETSATRDKRIVLGDHIWCSSNVSILKGVRVPNNCVIGYNSCLMRSVEEENALVGGYPARVLKSNITWKK